MQFARALIYCASSLSLVACTARPAIEITAPIQENPEQPTIEMAHQALAGVATKICPSGYAFDDSTITYGAKMDGKPATVKMKIHCK